MEAADADSAYNPDGPYRTEADMHNVNRRLGYFFQLPMALALCLHTVAGDDAAAPAPGPQVEEILLPATDGRVAWRDIIQALAEMGRFDPSALNNLPDGVLNLDSRRARLAILALDVALPPECSVSVVRGDGDGEPQLRITIDRAAVGDRAREIQRRLRERAGEDESHGLTLDEDWSPEATGKPLVVVIHGYNAAPRSLSGLHRWLRDEGWTCGMFSYPDDGPIDESAALLAEELRHFRHDSPERSVSIVAHSMGGLVARRVIEDPELDPGNVRQLIMVGTPNHGSMLAHFPGGFDWFEHRNDGRNGDAGSLFARAAADGLNEAAHDMRPESAFLRRLNAHARNPRVEYSLLLGTSAPLSESELDEFRSLISTAMQRNRLLQFVSPRIEEPLADLDELLDGSGDGAVAVKRGRLDGVEDTQLLPVSHLTITRGVDDPGAEELREAILTRLRRDRGAGYDRPVRSQPGIQ